MSFLYSEEERKASRRRMDTSYKEMMAGYERGMKAQSDKPSWAPIKTKHAEEPGPLTVTSVNQTKDLKVKLLFKKCYFKITYENN